MTTMWTRAAAATAVAGIATLAVFAVTSDDAGPAGATPPDTSVPGGSVPGRDTDTRTIAVTGRGTVTVTPDIAHVSLGVQATSPTGTEAMETISTKSRDLVDTLKALGVSADDLQTSGLSLWPNYDDDGTAIRSYTASVNVDATIRAVDRVGEIVDGAQGFVGEGLTIGGISFSFDEPETVLEEARVAAIDNARVRAEQYAEAAGVRLGDVVRVVEPAAAPVVPIYAEEAADMAGAGRVAIEPGTQELAADVTVVFAIA